MPSQDQHYRGPPGPDTEWEGSRVDQPKMFCSKLIQKQIDCDGVARYSTTQEADIRAWLIDKDMWGCRPVHAPMTDIV